MKFGNPSQIALVAAEVGGAVAAAPEEAQIELFDALIDGCKEAAEVGNLDSKVGYVAHLYCYVFPVFHRAFRLSFYYILFDSF